MYQDGSCQVVYKIWTHDAHDNRSILLQRRQFGQVIPNNGVFSIISKEGLKLSKYMYLIFDIVDNLF